MLIQRWCVCWEFTFDLVEKYPALTHQEQILNGLISNKSLMENFLYYAVVPSLMLRSI